MTKQRENALMMLYVVKAKMKKNIQIECLDCKCVERLTYHHKTYDRPTIDDIDLICWQCHLKRHNKKTDKVPKEWRHLIHVFEKKGKKFVKCGVFYTEIQ